MLMPASALIAPLIAAVTAFAVAFCPVWDFDVWFQLACGKTIVALRGLPLNDVFSFTAADRPWDTQEWLSQVLFYLAESRGGLKALTALKALLAAGLFFIMVRHAIRRGADPWIALGVSVWGSFLLRLFTVERPVMFTMLFLAVQLGALFRGRAPWWFVPLSLLWANLHGGSSLLGPGVTGIWLVASGAVALARREPLSTLRSSALVLAGQSLALLANPAGWHLLQYPFKTVGDTMYMSNVREWMPPVPGEMPGFFVFLAFSFLAFALTAKSWKLHEILAVALFGWLAMSARRHIPLFVIAVTPPLICAVSRLSAGLTARQGVRMAVPIISILLAVAVPAGLALKGGALRTGIRQDIYPGGGIRVLAGQAGKAPHGEPFRLYTLHKWGGYAEWFLPAKFRVFIDGRQLVFGTGLFVDYYRILEDMPEASDLLKDWKPDAFLLDYGSRLGARFARTGEAALIHWDDTCLLYMARAPRNGGLIRRLEYRSFNPERGFSGNPSAMEADIRRAIREAPDNGRPWTSLAALLLSQGRMKEARTAAMEALKRTPRAVPAILTAADTALAMRDWEEARTLISQARSADPSSCGPRVSAAKLALAQGNEILALPLLQKAVTVGEKYRKIHRKPEASLMDAYLLESSLFASTRDMDRASDSLRRAGNTAFELGNPSVALEIYRRGMKMSPGDARFPHNTGVILSEQGKNAEAIIWLQKAVKLDPGNADTITALGVAYYKLKLLPLARALWKQALEISPKHPEAAQYLRQTADKCRTLSSQPKG